MFCPNCGQPLDNGAKFCSNCGAAAPQDTSVNEDSAASETSVVSEPPAAGSTATPANDPPAPKAPPAEAPVNEAPVSPAASPAPALTISQDSMVLILRVVCGVLGAIFAFFALKGAFDLLSYLFQFLRYFPSVLRGYFPFGIVAYLFSFVLTLLLKLLSLAAPAVAAAALFLAAVKWEKQHADLVFCGVALAAVLRLALFVLSLPFTFLLSAFVYHGGLGLTVSFFSGSLLHILGYVAAAATPFMLMYLMGCAPVMGKSADQVKENVRASVRDISGKVQGAAGNVADKAAAAENPVSSPAPAASVSYSRLKKTNRSLLMYILLNLVTCGIYSYIFMYGLANDVNEVCDGDGEKTGGLLAYILLNLVTCNIYHYIWWYKFCNRMAANAPRYGVSIQENGTTYLLWTLVGIFLCGVGPFIALYQALRNMNVLCAGYNRHNGFTA